MDPLEMAKLLAEEHGLFITTVTERDRKTQQDFPAFVLYRRGQRIDAWKQPKNERIGRRKSPREMLELVKNVAGIK